MQATAKLSIILPVLNSGKYIGGIINDVRKQTIKNWECIIVDMGSSDGTGEIIEELTKESGSFILLREERISLGTAYNRALKEAKGRYIAFCNADAAFGQDYFETLYNTAFRNKSDLALSGMTGLRHPVQPLSPLDPVLAADLSLGGKLFKKSLIEEEELSFSDSDTSCELQFYLGFCSKASSVYACRDAFFGSRGIPADTGGISAHIDSSLLLAEAETALQKGEELLKEQYETIKNSLSETEKMAEREQEVRYERFKSALYCSFSREYLIDRVIRHIWTTDQSLVEKAAALLSEYRQKVFPSDWRQEVLEESRDMQFGEDELPDLAGIRNIPNITFGISGIKEKDRLNSVISCIYSQDSPQFEVFVHEDIYGILSDEWKGMQNLYPLKEKTPGFKNSVYEACHSRYLWYIDSPAYISGSLVKELYNYAEQNVGILFVSIPMKRRGHTSIEEIRPNAVSFIPEFTAQKRRTDYNQLDFKWVNKLISTAKLDAMENPFGLAEHETLDRFYRNSRYHKNPDISIVTDYSDEDILAGVRNNIVKLRWSHKLRREEKYLEKYDLREEHKDTFRNYKKRLWSRTFRFLTIKVIYPLIYFIHSLRPVDRKKVLFIEPGKFKLDGNLAKVRDSVRELGGYKIKEMPLGRKFSRRRVQLKKESQFIREMATARYVFTDEVLGMVGGFSKRKGTTLVQLWHGCGAFKQFGYSTSDYLFGGDKKEKDRYPGYRNTDLITVSSPEVIWAYQEAMGYKGTEVVKATGVSRTDVFYDDEFLENARKAVYNTAPEAKNKKIILYAPTFRGTVKKAKAPSRLDIRVMKEALGDEYFLLIKHHPYVKVPPLVPDDCMDFAKDVSSSANIDDLISCADICISDYSSLVFEYSLFEKPMIFFAYDIEDYDDWRGFYYDYEELTPGPVVYTTDEIVDYIRNIDSRFDRDEVIRFREKFMSACDGHATDRILKTIGME